MTDKSEPSLRIVGVENNIPLWGTHLGSVIKVKNEGGEAARNCKGKINGKQVSWSTPNSKGDRDIKTINAEDYEPLDICAFLDVLTPRKIKRYSVERPDEIYIGVDEPLTIAPTERGYDYENKGYRNIEGITEAIVEVTAENAHKAIAKIMINHKDKTISLCDVTL